MKRLSVLIVIVCFCLTSCASVFKGIGEPFGQRGTQEEVRFDSKPAGAEVWVNGVKLGTTPAILKLESKKTYTIEYRLDGKTKTVRLTNHLQAGYLILDILCGVFPALWDSATGAWYKFDTTNVIVDIQWPM